MNPKSSYKQLIPFEKRMEISKSLREKRPNHVPIVIQISSKEKNIQLSKYKYLVPESNTLGQFLVRFRESLHIDINEAIFMMTEKGILPSISQTIGELYSKNNTGDGFLYLMVASENAFG